MFCRKCGNYMSEGMKFCSACGSQLDQPSQTSSSNVNSSFYRSSYQSATNHSGLSTSLGGTAIIPERPKKKNPVPLIVGLIAVILVAVVISAIVFVLNISTDSSEKESQTNSSIVANNYKSYLDSEIRDNIVKNGYVTDEQDEDKAFKEMIDIFIDAIYSYDYDLFKTCLFYGDFDSDRSNAYDFTDKEYMAYYAPIHPYYDLFTEWSYEITDSTYVDDEHEIDEINDKYHFSGDDAIDAYYGICFDLTIKSDKRTVVMPCNFEMVYANGHWYFWYVFFNAWEHYDDEYVYTGDGIDEFLRDYVIEQ